MQRTRGKTFFGRSFNRRRNIGPVAAHMLECRRLLTTYSFSALPFDATDGANPQSGVVADAQGDLFGTAALMATARSLRSPTEPKRFPSWRRSTEPTENLRRLR